MVKKIGPDTVHAPAMKRSMPPAGPPIAGRVTKREGGFAIVLTLLLLLVLVLFSFAVLLLASSYYSCTRNMFEIHNCRIHCESALKRALDRHNAGDEEPRFFFDRANWQGRKLVPYSWNGYRISGELGGDWKGSGANLLSFSARKGPFVAEQRVELRQSRLEDFALYTDGAQALQAAALFDGQFRGGQPADLAAGGVVFRDLVNGTVTPESNADYRKMSLQQLDYPDLAGILPASRFHDDAVANGMVISGGPASPFWRTDHYEMNLDLLDISRSGRKWRINYGGAEIARVNSINWWFDGPVVIRQAFASRYVVSRIPVGSPLYICSSASIRIDSSLHRLECGALSFPLCLVASGIITIRSSAPRAVRLQACLVSLGSTEIASLPYGIVIEPGGEELSGTMKQALRYEVLTSTLLFEDEVKNAFLQSIEAGGRTVWFRGSVLTRCPLYALEAEAVHFESSRLVYDLLPSFPFVHVVDGSRAWR